jgi:hypothetical protein
VKIVSFYRMPYEKKKIIVVSFFLSGLIVIAIRVLSYQRLSRFFGKSCKMLVGSTLASHSQLEKATLIRRMIRLVSSITPWKLSCLNQALLARFWCKRYHIPYLLFIGVARDKKLSTTVEAHAWITAGAIAMTGGHALETHHVIASYSNNRLVR